MTERQSKIIAQRQYCEQNKVPYFAPNNGYCFSCGRDIYDKISLQKAGSQLITGCPICHRSFCD